MGLCSSEDPELGVGTTFIGMGNQTTGVPPDQVHIWHWPTAGACLCEGPPSGGLAIKGSLGSVNGAVTHCHPSSLSPADSIPEAYGFPYVLRCATFWTDSLPNPIQLEFLGSPAQQGTQTQMYMETDVR